MVLLVDLEVNVQQYADVIAEIDQFAYRGLRYHTAEERHRSCSLLLNPFTLPDIAKALKVVEVHV